MDRQYILPVSFAAAFHAALLFGIPSAPVAKPLTTRIPVILRDVPAPPKDEPPEIDPTEEPRSKLERVVDPPPLRSIEPPVALASKDDFITRTPPVLPGVDPTGAKINIDGIPGVNPAADGIIPKDWLDQVPRTRFQPAPNYPFEAKRDGLTGDVVVEFVVDTTGHVHDVRIVSSTHRMFEEPTMRAVSRWVFEPGRRHGELVRFRMAAPVVFRLNE